MSYPRNSTARMVGASCLTPAPAQSSAWRHVELAAGEPLGRELLEATFHGDIPGVRVKEYFTEAECEAVLARLGEEPGTAVSYQGLDLGTALGIPSHWEFQYTRGAAAWPEYFQQVPHAEAVRKRLFATPGDPVEMVAHTVGDGWDGTPVKTAVHPAYGRRLYVGLVRTGAPKLHCDWARWDFPGLRAVMQAGWNVYLSNPGPGGDLKVYRRLWERPGAMEGSGGAAVGNYDLCPSNVAGAEFDVIPCRTGDLVLAANRFLHEVTPCQEPEKRTTVAGHVVWMSDGTLAQFS